MPDKANIKTEIDLLSALEHGNAVSQLTLARQISTSVGLINALLKRSMQKGLIKIKTIPRRRYVYYLTPKGFSEKSRMVADYIDASLEFFRRAREEYVGVFSLARASGVRGIVLAGRGELAEIALMAAREVDVEILGILDGQVNVGYLHGLKVLRSLDGLPAHTVVITDSRLPQKMYDDLCEHSMQPILAPAFMRISIMFSPDEVP